MLSFFPGSAQYIKNLPRSLNQGRLSDPIEFWHRPLYWTFWLALALFPIGYGYREAIFPLAFVFLLIWLRYGWQESVLRRLGPKWLFYCAGVMIILGVVCSTRPMASLLHAGTGLNKAYLAPFIAMECVRSVKELKGLVWALALACFWQGLDGVWQAWSGTDAIMGYAPNNGRLTGSLGDYSVGNYIALAMIPAFGVWQILRRVLPLGAVWLLFIALFWPAFFLLSGASSRSGLLAVAGALGLAALMRYGWRDLRLIALPALAIGLFMLLQPGRLSPGRVIDDNRWDLWRLAWRVFCEHPWLGAGAGQYNAAFRDLGLAPEREVLTISHPHDLYLDLLYAHGLIGFTLGMIFLAGFLIWGFRRIFPELKEEAAHNSGSYWRLTTWFALGYAGWLINGIFGHDFYRTWWLTLAMCYLGVMIGAIVNGKTKPKFIKPVHSQTDLGL